MTEMKLGPEVASMACTKRAEPSAFWSRAGAPLEFSKIAILCECWLSLESQVLYFQGAPFGFSNAPRLEGRRAGCSRRAIKRGQQMRKSIWILALLVGAFGASSAYADSFDASFTCTTSCVDVPTDPGVSFPGPIIPISFFNQSFSITLNNFDNPGDNYNWNVETNSSGWWFVITDVTNGYSNSGPSFQFGPSGGTPYGSGCMNFTSVPEPGAMVPLLVGVLMVFVAWKRMGQSISQAN